MALPRKSRRVSRMLAHDHARAYVPRPQAMGDYIVEHKSGHAHKATERCKICQAYARNESER